MSQSEHEKAEKDLLELPKREMERWQSAPEFGSDKRIVAFKFSSFGHEESLDLLGFIDCVGERLDRWRQGCFKVCEAAQILADAYPNKIDARSLCEQMVQAIYAGDLILRKNGIPLPSNQIENRKWGAYFKIVEARDVNEWLSAKGAYFQLCNPYESKYSTQTQQCVDHTNPVEGATILLTGESNLPLAGNFTESAATASDKAVSKRPEIALAPEPDQHSWKLRVKDLAVQKFLEAKSKSWGTDKNSIATEMEKEYQNLAILSHKGKPLTAAYIARHALTPWDIPTLAALEEAKKQNA
jgi:hypothetical protein